MRLAVQIIEAQHYASPDPDDARNLCVCGHPERLHVHGWDAYCTACDCAGFHSIDDDRVTA